MDAALLAGLYAVRAQVDSLIILAERAVGTEAETPQSCPHTETEDAGSTLGGNSRRRCLRCGEIVT